MNIDEIKHTQPYHLCNDHLYIYHPFVCWWYSWKLFGWKKL